MRKIQIARYYGYLAGYFNIGSRDCPYSFKEKEKEEAWLDGNIDGHLDSINKERPKTKEEFGIEA